MEISEPELDLVVNLVRSEAFAGLLRGAPVNVSHVAARRRVPLERLRAALDQLVAAGAAEVAGDGEINGAHGLTTRTTRHAIVLGPRVLHTWCALDAVGIPVALGLDAIAITTCPTCGARLSVPVRAGRAAGLPFVLWLPTGPYAHLTRDFCSSANLFCEVAHAGTWRRQAGDPQGCLVAVAEVEGIARMAWADVAREGRKELGVDVVHDDNGPDPASN